MPQPTVNDVLDDYPIVFNWDTLNANPEGCNQYKECGGGEHHPAAVNAVKKILDRHTQGGKLQRPDLTPQQMEQQAATEQQNNAELRKAFPKWRDAAKAVTAAYVAKAHITTNEGGDDIQWITVGGAHIPIKGGESKDEAVKAHLDRIKSGEAKATKTQSVSTEHDKEHEGGTKEATAFQRGRETEQHVTTMKDPQSLLAGIKQAGEQIKSVKAAVGRKIWDSLTPGQQAGYTAVAAIGQKVEHKLEGAYKAGQNAAKEVMKAQGMSDAHIETAGKLLGTVDAIAKNVTNIPVAHEAIHALTHIGGPIAFVGAKVGYYTPVASLAYVGASLAKSAVGDVGRAVGRITGGNKDPFQTIKLARAAIRGAMKSEPHGEGEGHSSGHLAHGVAGAMHAVKGMSPPVTHADPDSVDIAAMKQNAPKIAKYVKDHDNDDDAIAHLYAALDETMGDVDRSIRLANSVVKGKSTRNSRITCISI